MFVVTVRVFESLLSTLMKNMTVATDVISFLSSFPVMWRLESSTNLYYYHMDTDGDCKAVVSFFNFLSYSCLRTICFVSNVLLFPTFFGLFSKPEVVWTAGSWAEKSQKRFITCDPQHSKQYYSFTCSSSQAMNETFPTLLVCFWAKK